MDTSALDRGTVAVRNFEGNLKQAFARTGDLRAHRAIDAFGARLAQGDITGGIEAIASRLTGLGLAGGIAIGALTAALVKFKQTGEEINVAFKDLDKNIRLSPATGASLEQIKGNVEALGKSMENLAAKTSGFWGSIIHGFSRRDDITPELQTAARFLVADYQNETAASQQTLRVRELIAAGLTREGALLKAHADATQQLIALTIESQKRLDEVKSNTALPDRERLELEKAITAEAEKRAAIIGQTADLELRVLKQEAVKPLLDKSTLTSAEIRAGAGSLSARLNLKQADISDKLGENFRLQGFTALAAQQFARADYFRAGIGELRPNERNPEYSFKSAIDSAAVLQGMLQTLASIQTNTANINLTNQ